MCLLISLSLSRVLVPAHYLTSLPTIMQAAHSRLHPTLTFPPVSFLDTLAKKCGTTLKKNSPEPSLSPPNPPIMKSSSYPLSLCRCLLRARRGHGFIVPSCLHNLGCPLDTYIVFCQASVSADESKSRARLHELERAAAVRPHR